MLRLAPLHRFVMLACGSLVGPVLAQCSTALVPGEGMPGTNGVVRASTVWDPDGVGPAPAVLVVGGGFSFAVTVAATRIAIHDPVSGAWSPLGSGMNGDVNALASLPNGDLVAGGYFSVAGGVSLNHVARWNGTGWSPLGSGVNGFVTSLAILPTGDLVVAGSFWIAGGGNASNVARWDGSSWSPLGSGTLGVVHALCTMPNGDLVAGGEFGTAGAVSAACIARWDGTSWSPLSGGLTGSTTVGGQTAVYALATLPNGDLVAGGHFTNAGGVSVSNIARWDGTSWSPLHNGTYGTVHSLAIMPNGDLIAGGRFLTAGSSNAVRIGRWDGANWWPLGSSPWGAGMDDEVMTITRLPNGDLVAGGAFRHGGDVNAARTMSRVARWNGTSWAAMGTGLDLPANAVATLANGDVVVAGWPAIVGSRRPTEVLCRQGADWVPLGSGFDDMVAALTRLPNGDLVAAGLFSTAGGVPAERIARWNGTAWAPLGSGITNGMVVALASMPNGDLVAAGSFTAVGGFTANRVARWNGVNWSPLGTGVNSYLNALAVAPNGDVFVGGYFNMAGSVSAYSIARWDGTGWSSLGSYPAGWGLDFNVRDLTVLPDGDVVVVATLTGGATTGIARWDGIGWSSMGTGASGAWGPLTALPNGDVVSVSAGVAPSLVRWNGAGWSPLVAGMSGGAQAFTTTPNGDLVAVGAIYSGNGSVSANVARITTTCPATATVHGLGCAGSAGPLSMAVTQLPWIGGTFRSSTTGVAPNALAFAVIGFASPGTPLASLHSSGAAGCSLHASLDSVVLLPASAGSIGYQLAIPASSTLVGVVLFHQLLQMELGAASQIVGIQGSNGLRLTVGSF